MNNYRVYMTWSDGDITTEWVDASSAEHACFLVGEKFGRTPMATHNIIKVTAVLETN